MKDIFETTHVTIMRHADKAARRGDFAKVDRLIRIAERLHRMHHSPSRIDYDAKALKNEERRVRIARLKHWTPAGL